MVSKIEDITSKILQLLEQEGVDPKETHVYLERIANDIHLRLWDRIIISPSLLYNLKDTVWYNVEHIPLGGESKGMSNLKYLGEKFPVLMYSEAYIEKELVGNLLSELGEIANSWSNEWALVQLFTKSAEGWNGGKDNPSPVVIYDPNSESPTKYGYKSYSQRPLILDPKGDPIQSQQQEIVQCTLETRLGTYGKEPLMRQLLERLIEACKRAVENEKGLFFEFNDYDYS